MMTRISDNLSTAFSANTTVTKAIATWVIEVRHRYVFDADEILSISKYRRVPWWPMTISFPGLHVHRWLPVIHLPIEIYARFSDIARLPMLHWRHHEGCGYKWTVQNEMRALSILLDVRCVMTATNLWIKWVLAHVQKKEIQQSMSPSIEI